MLLDEVRKLSPHQRIAYMIQERENIRLKKEAGEPKPWTDDAIFQQYRFCNVRRMNDKVSRWLWDNWYRPNQDQDQHHMVLGAVMARQFNKPGTLAMIGFPRVWKPTMVEDIVAAIDHPFNAAYIITGTMSLEGSKYRGVIWRVLDKIYTDPPEINTDSMEETWKNFLPYPGFSSFMAGQVTADLRWAITGDWHDAESWAPMGPGSRRGMNRLMGRSETRFKRKGSDTPMKQSVFLEGLASLRKYCRAKLPSELMDTLEAMDLQNCCCEFSKYEKALWGQGRVKQRYEGT